MALNNYGISPEQQDDYAAKMKAYEAMLDKNMGESSQAGQDYASATNFGKAIDTALAPTIRVGNVATGVMPKNYSRAEEITSLPGKVAMEQGTEAKFIKNLLERYKAMQDAYYKGIGLNLQAKTAETADERAREAGRHNLAMEDRALKSLSEGRNQTARESLNKRVEDTVRGEFQNSLKDAEDINKQLGTIDTLLESGTVSSVQSALSNLARSLGEKGVLTDQDTARVVLPTLNQSIAKAESWFSPNAKAEPKLVSLIRGNITKVKSAVHDSLKRHAETRAKRLSTSPTYKEAFGEGGYGWENVKSIDRAFGVDPDAVVKAPVTAQPGAKSREQMIADIKAKMGTK